MYNSNWEKNMWWIGVVETLTTSFLWIKTNVNTWHIGQSLSHGLLNYLFVCFWKWIETKTTIKSDVPIDSLETEVDADDVNDKEPDDDCLEIWVRLSGLMIQPPISRHLIEGLCLCSRLSIISTAAMLAGTTSARPGLCRLPQAALCQQ